MYTSNIVSRVAKTQQLRGNVKRLADLQIELVYVISELITLGRNNIKLVHTNSYSCLR